VDKVQYNDPSALIFIMGDFNDTPDNHSINEVLGAQQTFDHPLPQQLYNLLAPRSHKGMGSTYYKGWLLFDQIIVSGNVLLSTNFSCRPEDADIFNPRFLLHFNDNGQAVPNRTYRHGYVGGYSDHLPVYLRISLKD
jgi:endonuclease/exonuclease/phosphatase family metal-dependent hydrolase